MKRQNVIIVTGASRGIGAQTARCLADNGVAVVIAARSARRLSALEGQIKADGGQALAVAADIADPDAGRAIFRKTMRRFGRLDALVNNAGLVEPLAMTAEADPAAWRYNIDVNLLGPFYMVRACLDELRKQKGRIVNVSSGAANIAIEAAGAYCTAKAGLTHFTRILAAEETDVVSVAVRPGVVDTDMQQLLRDKGPAVMPPETAAYYRRLRQTGRLETPRVPARSVAWLAVYVPSSWSGRFLDYDDPQIALEALKTFGE